MEKENKQEIDKSIAEANGRIKETNLFCTQIAKDKERFNVDAILEDYTNFLDKGGGRFDPIYTAVRLTESLVTVPFFNYLIIENASKNGVKPLENYKGERLGAASCLWQMYNQKKQKEICVKFD
jgi:hypothetical protein